MIPDPSIPSSEPRQAAEAAVPRHLLRSLRTLNALYDELNQIVAHARDPGAAPRR